MYLSISKIHLFVGGGLEHNVMYLAVDVVQVLWFDIKESNTRPVKMCIFT
jgi:hypothetical protein